MDVTTTTSISISWGVPSGSAVDNHEVMWTSRGCPDNIHHDSSTTTDTSYTVEGLRDGTSYNITVSATNSAGTVYSDTVTGETQETGKWPFYVTARNSMYSSCNKQLCQ